MRDNLQIVMLTDGYHPDKVGGSYVFLRGAAERLAARGWNVAVITPRAEDCLAEREVLNGVRIFRFGYEHRGGIRNVTSQNKGALRLFKEIIAEGMDVLLNYNHAICSYYVNNSAAARALPKAYTFYGPWPEEFKIRDAGRSVLARAKRFVISKLMKHIEGSILASCGKIMVLSGFSTLQLAKLYKVKRDKTEIIGGAVDTDRFRPAADRAALRAGMGFASSDRIFFTARRLDERMGLFNLVEAFAPICLEDARVKLFIAGKGRLKEKIEARIAFDGAEERIKLLGCVSDEDLLKYYQAADAFVLPTVALEGFGLVTAEALSCGTPALGTPVGATFEVLGGLDRSLLFEDATPRAIAKGVRCFLESPEHFPSAERCRKYAVESFSWKKTVERIEKVYEGLIHKHIG